MSRLPNRFRSKLTVDSAEGIRREYKAGASVGELALRHGTTPNSVYQVLRGRSHVPTLVVRLNPETYARLRKLAAARGLVDPMDLSMLVVAAGVDALEETAA